MNITYIGHSGFLVEDDIAYLLFDYYEGDIPRLSLDKELFVFVSHMHHDHYNRIIWELQKQYPKVHFIISKDVPFSKKQQLLLGLNEEDLKNVLRVGKNDKYSINFCDNKRIEVITFRSTDCGVAFLVKLNERLIYHAGDLNLWKWKEEGEDYNQRMEKKYYDEIEKISNYCIDIAFLPMDPRQEEYIYDGIDYFLKKVMVKHVFPMHLWDKYNKISEYNKRHINCGSVNYKIYNITKKNQSFSVL